MRTVRRGYVSEFLSMAKTVQPQGFAPQEIDDLDGFDYMDVASRVKKEEHFDSFCQLRAKPQAILIQFH